MAPEMFIFARFRAKEGLQHSVAAAIQEVLEPTRQEPGCVRIDAFRSIRDVRLFQLPHTLRFVNEIQILIDHPLEVTHTQRI